MRGGEGAEADLVAQVFLNAKQTLPSLVPDSGISAGRTGTAQSVNSSLVQIKKGGLMYIGQEFNRG